MRKLFVSFTSLLRAMANKSVTADDLAKGLFYFGCAREHAHKPGASGEGSEVDWIARNVGPERAAGIHAELVEALLAAEAEGRAKYRDREGHSSFAQLSELLTANGYPGLPTYLEGHSDGGAYCYPGVEHRVKALGIEIEVIR